MSWKKLSYTLTGAALLAASTMSFAQFGTKQGAELRHAERPIQGEYIVVLKDNAASLAHGTTINRSFNQPSCQHYGTQLWIEG